MKDLSEVFSSSFGLEKKNSITSVESGLHTVEADQPGEAQTGENVVEPHMGLMSSCNMVNQQKLHFEFFFI